MAAKKAVRVFMSSYLFWSDAPTLIVILFPGYPQDQLPRVFALEKLEESVREGEEAIDHVFTRLHLSGSPPSRQFPGGTGVSRSVIEHYEPLHGRSVNKQRQIVRRPARRSGVVVLGDGPADHHPG